MKPLGAIAAVADFAARGLSTSASLKPVPWASPRAVPFLPALM